MKKLFLQQDEEKGITLIALVITIIVLLILAGITIATLTGENGILNRAADAKIQSDISQTKEQIKLELTTMVTEKDINGAGKYTKADVITAVKKVTGNDVVEDAITVKSKKGNDVNIADLWLGAIDGASTTIEDSKIVGKNVGDTIDWTPGIATKASITSDQSINGDSNQTIYRQNVEWVLLSKTDTQVTLVSKVGLGIAQDGKGMFYLKGTNGWLNAEEELNRICNELYGVRSLNVNDINTACGYTTTLSEASTTSEVYFPQRGGTLEFNGVKNLNKGIYTRLAENTSYTYTILSDGTNNASSVSSLFSSDYSWLASRYVGIYPNRAHFNVRYVGGGFVGGRILADCYDTEASESSDCRVLRPAVTLTIQ